MRAKESIYLALRDHPTTDIVRVEHSFKGLRADVWVKPHRGTQYCVEAQRSALSQQEAIERTTKYMRTGVPVVWLAVADKRPLHGGPYRPRLWERWLHELYGEVYYWSGYGQFITPVRFTPFRWHVPPHRSAPHHPAGLMRTVGWMETRTVSNRRAYLREPTLVTNLSAAWLKERQSGRLLLPTTRALIRRDTRRAFQGPEARAEEKLTWGVCAYCEAATDGPREAVLRTAPGKWSVYRKCIFCRGVVEANHERNPFDDDVDLPY
tara:strand:- start:109 stop:903 length:795 start_codon:yes stop_codon:yes gene_type:complete